MDQATVGLVMIVKNEEIVLPKLLDSVAPFLDYWVIHDTGSTDSTIDIIKTKLTNIPGKLYQTPWRNFGWNRTQSMISARGVSDYLLIMDADSSLEIVNPNWKTAIKELNHPAYNLRYCRLPYSFPTTRLVSGSLPWIYKGFVHEYICLSDEAQVDWKPVAYEGIRIHDHGNGSNHGNMQGHIDLLMQSMILNPNDTRATYYLGMTYLGQKKYKESLYWFNKRSMMDSGDIEEQWHAKAMRGHVAKLLEYSWEKIESYYQDAINFRPHRLESWFELMRHYYEIGDFETSFILGNQHIPTIGKTVKDITDTNGDILFIDQQVYDFGVACLYGISAAHMGEREDALISFNRVLTHPNTPPELYSEVSGYLEEIGNCK